MKNQYIFNKYSRTKTWNLGTPNFAISNHLFYERLGFKVIRIEYIEPGFSLRHYRKIEYKN